MILTLHRCCQSLEQEIGSQLTAEAADTQRHQGEWRQPLWNVTAESGVCAGMDWDEGLDDDVAMRSQPRSLTEGQTSVGHQIIIIYNCFIAKVVSGETGDSHHISRCSSLTCLWCSGDANALLLLQEADIFVHPPVDEEFIVRDCEAGLEMTGSEQENKLQADMTEYP